MHLSHRKGFLQAEEVAQRFRLTLLWPWRGTDDPRGIGVVLRLLTSPANEWAWNNIATACRIPWISLRCALHDLINYCFFFRFNHLALYIQVCLLPMHLTPAYWYRPTSHKSTNLKMIEPPPPLEELEILWSWCNWQFQWPQHWCHLRFAIYSVSADGGSAGQIFRSLGAFGMCSVTLYDFVTSCFISFGHPLMRWLQTDYFDFHINFIVVITTCCNMILWFLTLTALHYSLHSCTHKYLNPMYFFV